jgi:hypothetical protein
VELFERSGIAPPQTLGEAALVACRGADGHRSPPACHGRHKCSYAHRAQAVANQL